MKDLNQGLIIANMNSYLKKELMHSKISLNESGICNALATLYAQYVLQEKEDEFFALLELISLNKMHEETHHDFPSGQCLHFASQILQTHSPNVYEQHLSQFTSMNILKINKQPLTSDFDFPLSTDDRSWSEIFSQIQLQTDEVMIVRSLNHAISIRKAGDGYVVYDPNYAEGVKQFANEEVLVSELHEKVFFYYPGAMGLTLHIVRSPGASPRTIAYPEHISLYTEFLSKNLKPAQIGTSKFCTFDEAARNVRSVEVIEHLIAYYNPDQTKLIGPLMYASKFDNDVALTSLLKHLNSLNTTDDTVPLIKCFIALAAANGAAKAFNILIDNYKAIITYSDARELISSAVSGGNPEILSSLITTIVPQCLMDDYEDIVLKDMNDKYSDLSTESALSFKETNKKRLVTHSMIAILKEPLIRAVVRGNVECIILLTKKLDGQLDEKAWLACIKEAIRTNQEHSLNALIRMKPNISKKLLSQITLSAVIAANSDLGLLHSLINNGMSDSTVIVDIFNKKKENSYYSIQTLLMLVIGYIQKVFGKEQITHNEDQLIEEKKSPFLDLINETQLKYPNSDEVNSAFLEVKKQNLNEDVSFEQINALTTITKQKAYNQSYNLFKASALDATEHETSITRVCK